VPLHNPPARCHQALSVDGRGRVVYQYKQPFRDGSTHVVLEPLDFMAGLAVLVPTWADVERLMLDRSGSWRSPRLEISQSRRLVASDDRSWPGTALSTSRIQHYFSSAIRQEAAMRSW
jgi:hypothetical protein